MMNSRNFRGLATAVAAALSGINSASAVRLNTDGHGQALIYPYYTARTTSSGNAYVTALSVVNPTASAKAVKVRFLEGKAGADVLDFNLFLSQYDVWTAGIVAAGAGAGIFTFDSSCTSPRISNSSAAPTLFRNGAYSGIDAFGDSLDRTYEGYVELLEMGTIAGNTPLENAVTHKLDLSTPNASKPACIPLPTTVDVPANLTKPRGGLFGSASYINVNEGTDISVDAIALGQWSDKVQWGMAGSLHPNLADASPPVSTVIHTGPDGDAMIVSRWNNGRDAVSALLMVNRVMNDYTVEPAIKAATDWIITMPTKRFHMNGFIGTQPFASESAAIGGSGQGVARPLSYDREEQSPGAEVCGICFPHFIPFAATTLPWIANAGTTTLGLVLGGRNVAMSLGGLNAGWINGWADLQLDFGPTRSLAALPGQSIIVDTVTGTVKTNLNVTYHGLPVIGFAAQSYSTTRLPGVDPNVLSNYGGSFVHKVSRRIEISP